MTAAPDTEAFDRIARERFSCRAYLRRQVPGEILERLLRTAQRSASWCNVQPWRVIVTRGDGTERFRQALLGAAGTAGAAPDFAFPGEYTGIHQARRRECGLSLYSSLGIRKGDQDRTAQQHLENFRLFGAPHVAMITCDGSLGPYALVDCGAYVQTFMLAARSLGIASIAQAALATRADVVRAHFGLPSTQLVVCGISFGYADEAHPVNAYRLPRADLAEVVTWADT